MFLVDENGMEIGRLIKVTNNGRLQEEAEELLDVGLALEETKEGEKGLTADHSEVLFDNLKLFTDALTLASAKTDSNNEALEVLGDSVIALLVGLELFLFESYDRSEAYLSFLKQWRVSNMRLTCLSLKTKLFQYIQF